MKKTIVALVVCVTILLTGCAGKKDNFIKDNFISVDRQQPVIAENVEMTTEFPEYDGNTEIIYAPLKNNGNEDFTHGSYYFLQKLDGDDWRYLGVSGNFNLLQAVIKPGEDALGRFQLKDHVKLPLLPGRYRIGWWSEATEDGSIEPTPVAEFTVK